MTDLSKRAFLTRLSPVTPELPGTPVINHEKCIAWQKTICYICVDQCPEDAIKTRAGCNPVIEQTSCTGCGFCETACFANAIVMTPAESPA